MKEKAGKQSIIVGNMNLRIRLEKNNPKIKIQLFTRGKTVFFQEKISK
jgi:hypothetical protein